MTKIQKLQRAARRARAALVAAEAARASAAQEAKAADAARPRTYRLGRWTLLADDPQAPATRIAALAANKAAREATEATEATATAHARATTQLTAALDAAPGGRTKGERRILRQNRKALRGHDPLARRVPAPAPAPKGSHKARRDAAATALAEHFTGLRAAILAGGRARTVVRNLIVDHTNAVGPNDDIEVCFAAPGAGASIRQTSEEVRRDYKSFGRWRGSETATHVSIPAPWAFRVPAPRGPGLIIGGLVTLDARQEPGALPLGVTRAWSATWLVPGRGRELRLAHGWIARDAAGELAHGDTLAGATATLRRRAIASARGPRPATADQVELRRQNTAKHMIATQGATFVTFADARNAGCCADGIRGFARRNSLDSDRETVARVLTAARAEGGDVLRLALLACRQ